MSELRSKLSCLVWIIILIILFVPATICSINGGCSHSLKIDNIEYEPYGLINPDDKDESVKYQMSAGNLIWGIILIETIVAPVYLWGWYLYEPVELKEKE